MKKLLALFLCSAALLVAQVAIPAGNAVTITNSGNNIPGSGPYSPTSFPSGQVLYGNGSGPIASSSGFTTNGTSVNASSYGMLDQFALTNYGYINYSDASLSADRVLTLSLSNASRTLTISGNSTINQDTSTAGTPSFAGLTSTSTAILTSAATNGLQIYNTVDQTTNYERLEILWTGGLAAIRTAKGGTGTVRTLALGPIGGTSGQIRIGPDGSAVIPALGFADNSSIGLYLYTGAGNGLGITNGTNTQTSGTTAALALTPTYNQASGNAANTDLLINRTQTLVGSGTQLLFDAQVGGASKFKVDNTGVATANGTGTVGFLLAVSNSVAVQYYTDATNTYFDYKNAGFMAFRPAAGSGTTALTLAATSGVATFSPAARTSGVASYFTVTAPADTGQTAVTESIGINLNASATRTWADGTVAAQREVLVQAPTYNKTTSAATFTKAATFAISAAPTAGAGVTITNPYALWVQAGQTQLDGILVTGVSSLTYASPTSVDVTLASCYTVTTVNATGSVTFNATAGGKAGQEMTILITNDATSAKTITFGTNFLSTGTLTASAASRHTSITFKSDGTSWYETGRAVLTN